MKKPQPGPNNQPNKPGQPQPAVTGARPAQPPRPGQAPPAQPRVTGARPAHAPTPTGRPGPGPNAPPKEVLNHLAGQIQILASRLEGLRAQGAGNTAEFRQLEQMLNMVQDKLIMAQQKLGR